MPVQTEKRIYLDHSATTPVDAEVLQAMLPYFREHFGNASSIHGFGQEAKVALEQARSDIARFLHAEPSEIVFTSGGTEADNWAIKGTALAFAGRKKHIITSKIEHHAVLYPCQYLQKHGFEVTYLPVDETGMVSVQQVEQAMREDTFLISIMHANNEIGTINPVAEIAALARQRGVLCHTDAIQTFGKLPLHVREMNIDLLSVSAHKVYGPKGIGALYIRQGLKLEKLLHGGRHERDRRAGTENVAAAVGFAKAVAICRQRMESDRAHMRELSELLQTRIREEIPGTRVNGHPAQRLPGILNVSFEGVESDSLLLSLDLKGIAASNGSACTSGIVEPSHVILALGLPKAMAQSAIRFSLGRENTREDIEYTVDALREILARLRKLRRK